MLGRRLRGGLLGFVIDGVDRMCTFCVLLACRIIYPYIYSRNVRLIRKINYNAEVTPAIERTHDEATS